MYKTVYWVVKNFDFFQNNRVVFCNFQDSILPLESPVDSQK